MTATVSDQDVPLLTLANAGLRERPAELLPVDDPGYMALIRDVHPDLAYVRQRHRARGEVVHVFRDRVNREFVVFLQRDTGDHTIKESGFPWWDKLNQLAGMWQASQSPQRGGAR